MMALILPAIFYYQPQTHGKTIRALGCVALLGLIILNMYSISNYFTDPKHARDDYRYVAEYINANEDVLPILAHGNLRTFKFYTDQPIIPAKQILLTEPLNLRIITQNWNKALIIVNTHFPFSPFSSYAKDYVIEKDYLTKVLGPDFRLTDEFYPHYFKMYLFERIVSG